MAPRRDAHFPRREPSKTLKNDCKMVPERAPTPETPLGHPWDLPGTPLGYPWNLPGTTLGPTWEPPRTRSGSSLGRPPTPSWSKNCILSKETMKETSLFLTPWIFPIYNPRPLGLPWDSPGNLLGPSSDPFWEVLGRPPPLPEAKIVFFQCKR